MSLTEFEKEIIRKYEEAYERVEGYWMDKWRHRYSLHVIYQSPAVEAIGVALTAPLLVTALATLVPVIEARSQVSD